MTKNDVYERIAESARFGNLGLFIGSGFSKALFEIENLDQNARPLTWIELLKEIGSNMNVELDEKMIKFHSCPEIASIMCKKIAKKDNIPVAEARTRMKNLISQLTCWYSNQMQRFCFGVHVEELKPEWIITTNYDLLLESLLPDNFISLSTKDSFITQNGVLPIYHLHGIRTDPNSIIITNEDYIKLFRPNSYNLQKLSFTINESTTLMMGYSIGDPNVLTAIDWSENIYTQNKEYYPNGVIQLAYSDAEDDGKVVISEEGIIILKTSSLLKSIKDITKVIKQRYKWEQSPLNGEAKHRFSLVSISEPNTDKFINDHSYRIESLTMVNDNHLSTSEDNLLFLYKIFDECWNDIDTKDSGKPFKKILEIILDIFKYVNFDKRKPSLFELLTSNLCKVFRQIKNNIDANADTLKLWSNRKIEISYKIHEEIKQYVKCNGYDDIDII
ncbi:SIR2 family NAD-dependent protein deacylase [Spirochaeta cellobiosiphila]|uniref:SIR2 family NAD-dependent protein deacylase n=1 Tax=Spirochaeta cellobiosiphila TaxID=504483 RepID=UPI0004216B2A|nr:SIR2 family protein [Spirochaeta cellobiosiphila]